MSVREGYERHGATGFYRRFGDEYRNPHEARVHAVIAAAARRRELDLAHVLDLACGSGEATRALRALGAGRIDGVDPYTGAAYQRATGRHAESHTFEAVATGALVGRRYSLAVCSYALHLLAESWLPALCYQLTRITGTLLIVTPHKRPTLRQEWGWQLADEILLDRTRARLYVTG
jgi:SAM-dependent methyltransferase